MIVFSCAIIITIRIHSVIPIYLQFPKTEGVVTEKCLAQDAFKESPRTKENLPRYTADGKYLCPQIFLYSRIPYKAVLVSELYRLPKCIAPYKQSLS